MIKLKILVDNERWADVLPVLKELGKLLELQCLNDVNAGVQTATPNSFPSPFEAAMAVHTLMYGVTYFTHQGLAVQGASILNCLHVNLDNGVLDTFSDGTLLVRVAVSVGDSSL